MLPWSPRLKLSLLAAGLAASLLVLHGCATVDAHTTAYVGVEHPAPTLANEVQVLRTEPLRPHVRLGEVLIDASTEPAPPITEVEQKPQESRQARRRYAVVVVYDHIQTTGAFVGDCGVATLKPSRAQAQGDCDQVLVRALDTL